MNRGSLMSASNYEPTSGDLTVPARASEPPRVRFQILAAASFLLLATPALGDRPPRFADVLVLIAPFDERPSESTSCLVEVHLERRLSDFDFRVHRLETVPDDPTAALDEQDADFLVTGTVTHDGTSELVTAFLHGRGDSSPRRVTREGESACRDAAEDVLRLASTRGEMHDAVERRVQDARETLRRDPTDAKSLMVLGLSEFNAGRWSEAREFLARAAIAEPSDAMIHYALALTCKRDGDDTGRQTHLDRALELDPDNTNTLIEVGNVRLQSGRITEAIAFYEKCLPREGRASHPEDVAVALWNLAIADGRRGDPDAALARLEAIPPDSYLFTDARSRAIALRDEAERLRRDKIRGADARSTFEQFGIPAAVSAALALVFLAVLLSPLIPGEKIAGLDIPKLEGKKKRAVAIAGFLGLVAVATCFLPLWRSTYVSESRISDVAILEPEARALISRAFDSSEASSRR